MLTSALIDGEWVKEKSGRTFAVTDPSNGQWIADVPDLGRAETCQATDAAYSAQPRWAARTARERATILRRFYDLVIGEQERLAQLLTLEQGKTLAESRGEILFGASFLEWFGEEARRIYGDVLPRTGDDRQQFVLKQPVGVVACITPWNFPNGMVARKIAPALAAGCSVVVKPSEETPLSAIAMAELAIEAGVPAGVINVITARKPQDIGLECSTNTKIAKLSFTGSTAVGKLLMRQCADSVKRVSMELGGNAPFIVFEDADIERAVAGAISAKFRNTGQICTSANRIFVHDAVHDAFADRYAEMVRGMNVGRGSEPGVTMGPLINDAAVGKVSGLVDDALGQGARLLAGGSRPAGPGSFYMPTVLTDVRPDMRIAREEVFGPVASLFGFSSEEEAIALANGTRAGLAAYFYANEMSKVWRVAEQLQFGIVGVNESLISTETAPFGGWKESGIGREGSRYGIDDYLEMKYVCIGGL